MNELKIVITANGEGSRMKGISPLPKHLLWYKGKRIVDCIRDNLSHLGEVKVFGRFPDYLPEGVWMECGVTESRKAQLELIRDWKNVLIVDCDVIPGKFTDPVGVMYFDYVVFLTEQKEDVIWYFLSDVKGKYGALEMTEDGILTAAKERGEGIAFASGLYFLKDVGATIDRMTNPNSIASGMIGARMVFEKTFIRVGDPEDYVKAVLKK